MILKNSFIGANLTLSPRFTAYFTEEEITLQLGDKNYSWPLLALAGIEFKDGIVWAEATIKTLNGISYKLDGVDKTDGARWHKAFELNHLKVVAVAGREAFIGYNSWAKKLINRQPNKWHPSWMGSHLVKTSPPDKLKCGFSNETISTHPAIEAASTAYPKILPVPPAPPAIHLNKQLEELNNAIFDRDKTLPLFDTLESTPLTMEQRKAVICFDSKVLLIAAAGSGKTATMVAKAAYAIETEIVKPHEILMLAFNDDAAKELQQRLDKRLTKYPNADQITCKTFHSFGLSVIGEATGAKPRPAAWLEGGQDIAKVTALMDILSKSDPVFHTNLMLVRTVFSQPIGNSHGSHDDQGASMSPFAAQNALLTMNGETGRLQELSATRLLN
ncbi:MULTISPECIES: UvrD-helicase domain-containing protein [Pseudomonas]|uniref:UvrD-helicase domain-containing protein n=1 Tax=Pseudomonas TaxID=286 RepID=UPI0030019723